jgi:hypothetical protein
MRDHEDVPSTVSGFVPLDQPRDKLWTDGLHSAGADALDNANIASSH